MTAARYKNAWIWLAVAAMAVASLARVQAGIESATAYANPVFEFLAGHPADGALAATSVPRLLANGSARQAKGLSHGADPGAWMAILPVLFVGLVAPLNLLSPRAMLCLGRRPAAPALPFSFQRPPPSLLF